MRRERNPPDGPSQVEQSYEPGAEMLTWSPRHESGLIKFQHKRENQPESHRPACPDVSETHSREFQ